MIKLKFDSHNETMDLYKDKMIVTTMSSREFGELINEIKRLTAEANPDVAEKQARKLGTKMLKRQLKILVTVRLIEIMRKIKAAWAKVKWYFRIINQ